MDRRNTLGLLLFVFLFYTWALLRAEPEVPGEDEATDVETASTAPAPVPTVRSAPTPPLTEAVEVAFEGCGAVGTWSSRDGLHGVELPDHEGPLHVQPLYSWVLAAASGEDGEWKPWGDPPGPEKLLSEFASTLSVGAGSFRDGPATLAVADARKGLLVLEGTTGDVRIRHQVTVKPSVEGAGCVLDVDTTWTNQGANPITVPLWVGTHEFIEPMDGGMLARYDSRKQPLLHVDDDLAYGSEQGGRVGGCLLYTSPSPRDGLLSRMPSSA